MLGQPGTAMQRVDPRKMLFRRDRVLGTHTITANAPSRKLGIDLSLIGRRLVGDKAPGSEIPLRSF